MNTNTNTKASMQELKAKHLLIRAKKELSDRLLAIASNPEAREDLAVGLCHVTSRYLGDLARTNEVAYPELRLKFKELAAHCTDLMSQWPNYSGSLYWPISTTDSVLPPYIQHLNAEEAGTLYDPDTAYGALRLELALFLSERLAREYESDTVELAREQLASRPHLVELKEIAAMNRIKIPLQQFKERKVANLSKAEVALVENLATFLNGAPVSIGRYSPEWLEYGLCFAIDTFADEYWQRGSSSKVPCLAKDLMCHWPRFSGSVSYPVPAAFPHVSEYTDFAASEAFSMTTYMYEGEYGKLRIQLAHFLGEQLLEIVNLHRESAELKGGHHGKD